MSEYQVPVGACSACPDHQHRLAHCKQMNHSKAFWAVRNQYADQMRHLWSQGYTGEGLWGRGALLGTGDWESNSVLPGELLPEHLCGGTYRSRRRKRKAKPTVSYQERKERRILKKFGANGVALGADEDVKANLEKGKRTQAKPRVAGSARGRELRAAAALARFDQQKKTEDEEVKVIIKDEEDGSETESEYEDDASDANVKDAVDIDGRRLVDAGGRGMVRVCEDENQQDEDVQKEMRELQASIKTSRTSRASRPQGEQARKGNASNSVRVKMEEGQTTLDSVPAMPTNNNREAKLARNESKESRHQATLAGPSETETSTANCPICLFASASGAITCTMCAHVLQKNSVTNIWQCRAATCNPDYVNAGDCGVCGVCGTKRGNGK
jgi:DNA-dependent metalloprotease WSS1